MAEDKAVVYQAIMDPALPVRVKGVIETALGYIPGGGIVASYMNEEHYYAPSPNQSNAVLDRSRRDQSEFQRKLGPQFFLNKDGLAIFWRSWKPETLTKAKAVIVLSHGMAEHSGRYETLGQRLAKEGYVVYALDHQGHGQSEGERLYVRRFEDFVADVHQFTRKVKCMHPQVEKTFLLSHSMGALIATNAAHAAPGLYTGVIISSPPLKVDLPPIVAKVAGAAAFAMPKLPFPGLDIATLCRDDAVVDRYMNDPLNIFTMSKLRLMSELVGTITNKVPLIAEDFSTPYLLMHGTGDKICEFDGSKEFHAKTPAKDKTFVSFPDHFHELFNEPDNEENALKFTLEWLQARTL